MTTIPPQQLAYDGVTRFGVWQIPGRSGPQALVLASEKHGGAIQAVIDGQVVLTVPRPKGDNSAVASEPCQVDGHMIVVYAERRGAGQMIRCDLFVDGNSMTTGEPITVIPQRMAALAQMPVRKGFLAPLAPSVSLIPFIFFYRQIDYLSRHGTGINLAIALGVAVAVDVAAGCIAYFTLTRLVDRLGLSRRRAWAVAVCTSVATLVVVATGNWVAMNLVGS